jgi:hypothetical protein
MSGKNIHTGIPEHFFKSLRQPQSQTIYWRILVFVMLFQPGTHIQLLSGKRGSLPKRIFKQQQWNFPGQEFLPAPGVFSLTAN